MHIRTIDQNIVNKLLRIEYWTNIHCFKFQPEFGQKHLLLLLKIVEMETLINSKRHEPKADRLIQSLIYSQVFQMPY